MTREDAARVLKRRASYLNLRLKDHFSDTESGAKAKDMFEQELEAITIAVEDLER